LGYWTRLYGGLRRANRSYSRERDMSAAPFPRVIQLQTINACQAACTMCPYPAFKDVFARGRMDDDLFDKITDEIARHPEVETFVPMLQNEPLLDKHIFEKIARFKRRTAGRVSVELVTNGALLTDEHIARLRDAELDVLDVSLDALSRDVYERIRIGLDYDTVLAGVERVIAADLPGTSVFVRLVRQRDNAHEVRAFAGRWRKRGVPVFIYDVTNRTGALDDFDASLRVPPRAGFAAMAEAAKRQASRAWLGHCPIPFASASVLHNGDVLMCTHDWARDEVIGNLRDHTLAELWNGDRMREIRALVSERRYEAIPACRQCSLWRDGWF
ncbi:MAG: radical SAM protein, partial [Gemmatimonadaceae bacterium]